VQQERVAVIVPIVRQRDLRQGIRFFWDCEIQRLAGYDLAQSLAEEAIGTAVWGEYEVVHGSAPGFLIVGRGVRTCCFNPLAIHEIDLALIDGFVFLCPARIPWAIGCK
jgi:hypothetical protein